METKCINFLYAVTFTGPLLSSGVKFGPEHVFKYTVHFELIKHFPLQHVEAYLTLWKDDNAISIIKCGCGLPEDSTGN
jgi:hypothetical protein